MGTIGKIHQILFIYPQKMARNKIEASIDAPKSVCDTPAPSKIAAASRVMNWSVDVTSPSANTKTPDHRHHNYRSTIRLSRTKKKSMED